VAHEQVKREAVTVISTERLEGLVADSLLLQKYAKVIEDLSVTTLLTRAGLVCHIDANVEEDDFFIRIENAKRIIEHVGPRKDWRQILDRTLTIWSEKTKEIDDE